MVRTKLEITSLNALLKSCSYVARACSQNMQLELVARYLHPELAVRYLHPELAARHLHPELAVRYLHPELASRYLLSGCATVL